MDFRELDALKCNMEQFPPLTKGQVEAIEREKKIEHVWSGFSKRKRVIYT